MPYLEEQISVKSQSDGNKERYCLVSEDFTSSPENRGYGVFGLYTNKGRNKYNRAYAEVQKSNVKGSE